MSSNSRVCQGKTARAGFGDNRTRFPQPKEVLNMPNAQHKIIIAPGVCPSAERLPERVLTTTRAQIGRSGLHHTAKRLPEQVFKTTSTKIGHSVSFPPTTRHPRRSIATTEPSTSRAAAGAGTTRDAEGRRKRHRRNESTMPAQVSSREGIKSKSRGRPKCLPEKAARAIEECEHPQHPRPSRA